MNILTRFKNRTRKLRLESRSYEIHKGYFSYFL